MEGKEGGEGKGREEEGEGRGGEVREGPTRRKYFGVSTAAVCIH